MPNRRFSGLILGLATALPFSARAEDGYRLWLRYDRLPDQVIDADGEIGALYGAFHFLSLACVSICRCASRRRSSRAA